MKTETTKRPYTFKPGSKAHYERLKEEIRERNKELYQFVLQNRHMKYKDIGAHFGLHPTYVQNTIRKIHGGPIKHTKPKRETTVVEGKFFDWEYFKQTDIIFLTDRQSA